MDGEVANLLKFIDTPEQVAVEQFADEEQPDSDESGEEETAANTDKATMTRRNEKAMETNTHTHTEIKAHMRTHFTQTLH